MPIMHRKAAAGWLLVLLALGHATSASASDACANIAFKTLTFDCASQCASGHACLAFNASEESPCKYDDISPRAHCVLASSSSASCDVMCFAPRENDSSAFQFNVAFNKTRVTRPPPGQPNASTAMDGILGLTDDVAYETNAFVRRVGKLNTPPGVTDVVISGGRATKGTRGTVVDIQIDPSVFTNASQVTSVSLLNIDLAGIQPGATTLLPRQLLALDLSNTKLTNLPPVIYDLPALQSLTLDRNYLVDFPHNLNFSSLKTLSLQENDISTFSTVMTSIELLNLASNNLTVFPYEVLTWENLHTLHVEQNDAMAKVVFTKNQIMKLSSLEAFSMDTAVLDAASCSSSQVQLLPPNKNVSVCVLSEEEWLAYQTQLVSSFRKESTKSSSRILTIIALSVTAGVALLVLSIRWSKRRSKNTKTLDGSTSSLGGGTDPVVHSNGSHFEKLITSKASDVFSKSPVNHQASDDSTPDSSSRKRYTLHSDVSLLSRRIRMEHIVDTRIIGSGGFAVVWLVEYLPQNRLLASKRLIKDQVTRQKTMDFVMEIKLNMQLDHPNIVQLVGVAWTIETDLQALLEYMPNGDLRAHLESTSQTTWDAQKLQLAIDIVEALVYVHSFSPPLVHRDLKSRNVLLADDMKAKLCDFGVSRFASVNNTMTTAVGTGKWLAPEVVAGSKSYDESCDIYSFGVVMTELDTHRLPYDDVHGPNGDRLPEVAVLQMVSSGQIQPTLSDSCPDQIRRIALKCLSFNAEDRPTSHQVAHWLRTIRQAQCKT